MRSAIGQADEEESELSLSSWWGSGIKLLDGIFGPTLARPLILNADVAPLIASPKYLMEAIPTTDYQW